MGQAPSSSFICIWAYLIRTRFFGMYDCSYLRMKNLRPTEAKSLAQSFIACSEGGKAEMLNSWTCRVDNYLALQCGFESLAGVGYRSGFSPQLWGIRYVASWLGDSVSSPVKWGSCCPPHRAGMRGKGNVCKEFHWAYSPGYTLHKCWFSSPFLLFWRSQGKSTGLRIWPTRN